MLLKLLKDLGIDNVFVAGADGYLDGGKNYYKASLKSSNKCDANYNATVAKAINRIGIEVSFLTESAYV